MKWLFLLVCFAGLCLAGCEVKKTATPFSTTVKIDPK